MVTALICNFKVLTLKSGTVRARPPVTTGSPTSPGSTRNGSSPPSRLFAVLAIAIGHNVEQHLKAAGFTDPASESERATDLLATRSATTRTRRSSLVVRNPGGGKLDTERPRGAPRGRPAQPRHGAGRIRRPGRQPAARPARRRRADRPRRRIAGGRRLPLDDATSRTRGASPPKAVEPLVASSPLDVPMGGFAAGFNETNDQTHNRPDQGRADRLPDARPAAAVRLPRRRRGGDPAADRRSSRSSAPCSCCGSWRASPTPRVFALNIATGLSLGLAVDYALLLVSRYREEIGARRCVAGGAPSHRSDRRPHGGLLRPHGRRGDGGADLHAAALPLLDGGRGRLGGGALLGDRDPRRALAAAPCWGRASTRSRSAAGRRCPTPPTGGTAWPAA